MYVSICKKGYISQVLTATDQAFRGQHEDFSRGGYTDYDGYIRRIFDNTNNYLRDTFSDSAATPHIVVTTNSQGEWGRWDNPDGPNEVTAFDDVLFGPISVPADTPLTEARQIRNHLEWPVRDREVDRRGADVLSGFSGQPTGDPDSQRGVREVVAGQFVDAAEGTPEGESFDTDDDGDFGDAPVTSNISTGM